jgi:5-methylcytosine-specific restriction endonuclease McrBC GTP-binding regulatory subunit McrB
MGDNIIYYGPPGTGKTYLMQNLRKRYTDFVISEEEIKSAYVKSSKDWVLLTLILLQNGNSLSNTEIQQFIQRLNVPGFNKAPSTVLTTHSISLVSVFQASSPQIFNEENGKWYVVLSKLLEFDPNFFKKYLSETSIKERFYFVTFHQSFAYEDFIEGIRPKIESKVQESSNTEEQSTIKGDIQYEIQDGIFKKICEEAERNPTKDYAIFIDEINRGNIAEIFGDLISLIEIDKRKGMPNELSVYLPYSKKPFSVPQNLSIYGTMNSADRSIALMDVALRRRFEFRQMSYDLTTLENILTGKGVNPKDIDGIDLLKLLETMNRRIELLLDENFVIGHAYFTHVTKFESLKSSFINKIIPLLEEYFFEDLEKVQLILSDIDGSGDLKPNAIYKHEMLDADTLFEYQGEMNIISKKKYFVNPTLTSDSFIKIYA